MIHVAEIFEMGLFLALLGFALFIKWLHPSVLGLLIGTALGAGLGLAGGFVFFYNTSYKQLLNDGVRPCISMHTTSPALHWQGCR